MVAESPPLEAARALVGVTLRGKWRLDALIGVGGMANVYAATHRNGRRGAVKLLNRMFSSEPEIRARFLREGYVANRIRHPGVVSILDDDEAEDGAAFLVMELLDGVSLFDELRERGRLAPLEALFIADQLLDVLAAAHRARVIHRDIKPGNVFLLRDGRVKVLDFGLARVLDAVQQDFLTREGLVLGTVCYMAPEQARASRAEIDERSDLFAVGATLFTALSGQYVHEGTTPMDQLVAAAKRQPRSLAEAAPGIPAAVVTVVDRSVRVAKAERYQSAEEMQAAVRAAFAELSGSPLPPTQRVSLHGIAGWVRPTTPALLRPAGAAPGDGSLSVSVVFEPDVQQAAASVPLELTDAELQTTLGISILVEPAAEPASIEIPVLVDPAAR